MVKTKMTLDIAKTPMVGPIIRQRRSDRETSSVEFTILSNGSTFDLTGYIPKFEGKTSKGSVIVDDNVKVVDAKKGLLSYQFSIKTNQNTGAYQTAYISLTKSNIRETTNNFGVLILPSADLSAENLQDYLTDYEKMLQELKDMYVSFNIDGMVEEITSVKKDMTDLRNSVTSQIQDMEKEVSTSISETKKDVAVQIKAIQSEVQQAIDKMKLDVQASIDEITKTLAEKDVAVRGEINNFTGDNNFDKPIGGGLKTRLAEFSDIKIVTADMIEYVGNWAVNASTTKGLPVNTGSGQLEVTPHADESGEQVADVGGLFLEIGNDVWRGYVAAGSVTWEQLALDSKVAHLNETKNVALNSLSANSITTPTKTIKVTGPLSSDPLVFYRKGEAVEVTGALHITTAKSEGSLVTDVVIPNGYKPIIATRLPFVSTDGKYVGVFAFGASGSLAVVGASLPVGTLIYISGTWLTSQTMPAIGQLPDMNDDLLEVDKKEQL
ncbi:BppU family phage baseplate upper protein [Weissella kandleri]|uniref:BppU family phage baseplate upper protein n=1 Tax=Weissella kandleri TaxID=1616 RepID=UPI00387E44B0